jgi:hypothetical protein
MQLIDSTMVTLNALTLPDTLTKEDWTLIHRDLLLCKKAAAKWIQQSRDYSTDKWGLEFTADTEAQLELDLGLPMPEDKPTLNPDDKTKAIVTIEGLSQKFEMWERKMHDEIDAWDKPRLERALELLTPMEATAARIRQLLT